MLSPRQWDLVDLINCSLCDSCDMCDQVKYDCPKIDFIKMVIEDETIIKGNAI